MMRLLITGAGGFIGSHLVEHCMQKGYEVRAFVHYNSVSGRGWLDSSDHRENIDVVAGDIRDYDSVYAAMEGCEAVLHLAALIGIPYSYVSPLAYVRTNVEGTYNVLEAGRRRGVQQVLVTSTSETYGTAQYVPINESHPSVGQSPYAATKIAADQLALSYFRSFDLPVKVVRPFNTYGPRQSARAIIPTVVTQLLGGGRVITVGNTAPTRDLTYVEDTARGFLEILNAPSLTGQATNIGMNKEITIHDLILLIADIMGTEVEIRSEAQRLRPEKSEVERLMCDHGKLIRETSWRSLYTLRQGLEATIDWLRNHRELYRHNVYNQ